jgi:hypothetical protein
MEEIANYDAELSDKSFWGFFLVFIVIVIVFIAVSVVAIFVTLMR